MSTDFDSIVARRRTGSMKCEHYPADVLPLWVADMDFPSPEPVIRALQERVAHGFFGYPAPPPELAPLLCERLERLYGWRVTPELKFYIDKSVDSGMTIDEALRQVPPTLAAERVAEQEAAISQREQTGDVDDVAAADPSEA